MKAEEYQELKALFLALRDVGVEERTGLIEQHCGDDAEKRRELERLLEAHDRSDDPLGADLPCFSRVRVLALAHGPRLMPLERSSPS